MSIEGALPPAGASGHVRRLACGSIVALLAFIPACRSGRADSYPLMSAAALTGRGVAEVRLAPCGDEWCESLWLGPSDSEVSQLTMLPKGQHCEEVSWTPDGRRVAFLIDGYQLRIYESEKRAPAGQVNLVDPDGPPTTRIARGVTFSQNGAAITFDDCPRARSGCRPGLVAIR